ncbi:hypothetical protein [Methylobacterium sp. NFXW15]|uniref:hypothetical protein n=1 Tax=Methylobacterium sp. NFXW15 TaxID=2819512 RepID=UPI003CEEA95A
MAAGRNIVRLRRLFTRKPDGWGARSGIEAHRILGSLVGADRVTVMMHRLPLSSCSEAASVIAGSGARESVDHLHLKRAALLWMRENGATDAAEEVRGYDGRFDGYSADADWIVEVGNSSVDKLLDAIRDDECPRFTLIPFQRTHWLDGTPRRLIAVDFHWDDQLCADLTNEMVESQREAMESAARRHRAAMIAEAQARKAARQS